MNEPVERVAKAIAAEYSAEDGESWEVWQSQFMAAARAAIAAIREPTPEMVLAGYDQLDNEVTPHAAEACWYAMVDEMLK